MATEDTPPQVAADASPGAAAMPRFDVGAPVGVDTPRLKGREKAMGRAAYAGDVRLPGMLWGAFVGAPIAHGSVRAVDASTARTVPGVVEVLTHETLPRFAAQPTIDLSLHGQSFAPMQDPGIRYAGQPVALVLAETALAARAAVRRVRLNLGRMEPAPVTQATPGGSLPEETYAPERLIGVFPGQTVRGEPAEALEGAARRVDVTCRLSTNHHHPIELEAVVATWHEDGTLEMWISTQVPANAARSVADFMALDPARVIVRAPFVGGGFGCKGLPWADAAIAAIAARVTGRPVRVELTRSQMFTNVGHREPQQIDVSLGLDEDGGLQAITLRKTSATSQHDDYAEPAGNVVDSVYASPNTRADYRLYRAHVMTPTFMRGVATNPGHCGLEIAMDEAAEAMGIDPVELRLRNFADRSPGYDLPWSSNHLRDCYERGATIIGWDRRAPPGGSREGDVLVGLGMAAASYPFRNVPSKARATLDTDGRVRVACSSTDLGTGTYTILAQTAASCLGLVPTDVSVELGETDLPEATGSIGATAATSTTIAVHMAATALRERVIERATAAGGPLEGRDASRARFEDGVVRVDGEDVPLRELAAGGALQAEGAWTPPERPSHAVQAFGAVFAAVAVDPMLGVVTVRRLASVYDAGRVINPRTARAQMTGGNVMGLGQALMERTVCDPNSGRWLNDSLAGYHVPVLADIPEITVEFVGEPDMDANPMGTKGIGELGTVGVAPAVSNAVYNAIGRRIRSFPLTPDRILA